MGEETGFGVVADDVARRPPGGTAARDLDQQRLQVGWVELFGQLVQQARMLAFQASDDITHFLHRAEGSCTAISGPLRKMAKPPIQSWKKPRRGGMVTPDQIKRGRR